MSSLRGWRLWQPTLAAKSVAKMGQPTAVMLGLSGLALEGRLLGVGERVFRLEGCGRCSGDWLRAGLALFSLVAERLELLGLAAQAAYFYAGFGNEIAHRKSSHRSAGGEHRREQRDAFDDAFTDDMLVGGVGSGADGAHAVERGDADGGGKVSVGTAARGGFFEREADLGSEFAGLFE